MPLKNNIQKLTYICTMKKIFILSLLIITSFIACKNDSKINEKPNETKADITHLKSDSLKIEFDFPKNWQAVKTPNQFNLITLKQPLVDSLDAYQENILVWTEQLPMNISDSIYHLTTIAQLKISNPNLTIENKGTKQIGDKIFYQYAFEFTPADSNHYIVNGYTYFNTKDSMGYNFNGTADKKNAVLFQKEMETILISFKSK
jgi:hypothetical protein